MYARSRGWRIHYVVAGSGPALVLVPGLMASASSWADAGYVLRFSEEFQVIAVDPVPPENPILAGSWPLIETRPTPWGAPAQSAP